ncbi:MAG TPA: phosphoribosylanthranilate isomerase [Candidatus Sulfotelmatobacter sp.]
MKICGMTNLEDALVAVDAGADAVGFVFYEKSPRCVSVQTAREIVGKLPEGVEKVGVFVGQTTANLVATSNSVGLTAAQLYPDANGQLPTLDDEFFREAQCDVIVALSASVFQQAGRDPVGFFFSQRTLDRILAILVDAGDGDRPGGTGTRFDWGQAPFLREGMIRLGTRLIVAGGLSEANAAQAVEAFRPWGVDVASGVEARPGKKDPEKVRAFVRAVREFDRKVS